MEKIIVGVTYTGATNDTIYEVLIKYTDAKREKRVDIINSIKNSTDQYKAERENGYHTDLYLTIIEGKEYIKATNDHLPADSLGPIPLISDFDLGYDGDNIKG